MGYTTKFFGSLKINPPLFKNQVEVVNEFHKVRHGGNMDAYIVPNSFYCQWEVSEDGSELMWDGMEKFYGYVHWLHHLNNMFFAKFQSTLEGSISWVGEDPADTGTITAVPTEDEHGVRSTIITPAMPTYKVQAVRVPHGQPGYGYLVEKSKDEQ